MKLSVKNLLRGSATDCARADSASSNFRTRREQEHLLPLIQAMHERLGRPITILDIGGRTETWRRLGILDDGSIASIRITNFDEGAADPDFHPKATFEGGVDARQLPFADASFDLIYSNSVIEHVGDLRRQQAMVREIERVAAAGIYLQTPNKNFVIDPHFARIPLPFFQWLPLPVRGLLLWRLPMAHAGRLRSYAQGREVAAGVTLLGPRTLLRLFDPAGRPSLRREKFARLTKSLMVVVDTPRSVPGPD